MKNKKLFLGIILIVSSLLAASFLLVPSPSLAQEGEDPPPAESSDPSLPNPLGLKEGDLISVMLRVLQICLAVVDIFALFMFILGGFEFLISGGNPNMIKKAKDTLVWATLGILVITLSYTILKFVFEEIQKGLV